MRSRKACNGSAFCQFWGSIDKFKGAALVVASINCKLNK